MRQKLKQTRKDSGKTQKEIAKAIGISERMYQKIETEKSTPNVETAISIARVLGIKVEELFTFTTKNNTNLPIGGQNKIK
jgi:DNA-binding XRE family transcriptional regulator